MLLVGDEQGTKAVDFHPIDIHSVEYFSEVVSMLEIKDGPYAPNSY